MHPIQNPLDVPLSGSRRTTMQMVAAAIDHAAVRRGWAVEHPEMGLAVLTLTKPKYRVQIELHYSATALSINYGGSEGLRYDGLQIHRNYNKWINALASDIRRRVLSSSNRM